MRKIIVAMVLMLSASILLACKIPEQATEAQSGSINDAGINNIWAVSKVYNSYPMIDAIIIEYGSNIVLPDISLSELYCFTDGLYDTNPRNILDVYTNDKPALREDALSVSGQYVIIQLENIENPQPDSGTPWTPESMAGLTVLTESNAGRSTFRLDYSAIEITQKFDMQDNSGQLVYPAEVIPQLKFENIIWPEFDGFSIDNILEGSSGTIHYSYYLPDNYSSEKTYPLIVALPGYGGLLLSDDIETQGVNLFTDRSALMWTQAAEDIIILAPQLTGWSELSALQTIEITEYFIENFAVDRDRIYGMGYSAGGETMSRVLGLRGDLFAACLHVSSRWTGEYELVVNHQVPVYIFMGENDEYYGAQAALDAYERFHRLYTEKGLSQQAIDDLLVLDMPDNDYFHSKGIYYYHSGEKAIAHKPEIIQWILQQKKH